MRRYTKIAVGLAALLFLACPVAAQVTIGDNLDLRLSGNLGLGYSGSYGESTASGHGINTGGQGQLDGSYYNPNFLAFRLQPYYNRSQNNSSFLSITNSSGYIGDVDFFHGSHFPGTFSFSKSFDGSGQFAVPGISGFTSHGGSQSYGITWSEVIPDWPTLTATYTLSSEHSEVFGASGENHDSIRNLNLQSYYTIADFRLNGMYMHQTQAATFPELLIGQPETNSRYASDTFNIQGAHRIFMNGEWYGAWTHSGFSGDVGEASNTVGSDGSNQLFSTGLNVSPTPKLSLSFNTDYNTNVYAALQQQVLQAGGGVLQNSFGHSSRGLGLNGFAFYTLTSHIALTGFAGHQTLFLPDGDRNISRYGGSVNFNYAQDFLGSFNFSIGAVDLMNEQGNQGGGLTGNVNFSRKVHGWELAASFNYSQYVQTLLATYTTSMYTYNGSVHRRWRSGLYWNAGFTSSRSALARTEGTGNHSEAFNTSIIYRRYSLNGNYTQAAGTSILTSHGIVPLPPGVPTDIAFQQFQYGARGFGFGASAVVKRFVWTAAYSKSNGHTFGGATPTNFDSRMLTGRLQYRVRKMYFNAGVTHFQQGFGALGTQPIDFNTYFVGFTRWFNVF